jgi:hypothetical protein
MATRLVVTLRSEPSVFMPGTALRRPSHAVDRVCNGVMIIVCGISTAASEVKFPQTTIFAA